MKFENDKHYDISGRNLKRRLRGRATLAACMTGLVLGTASMTPAGFSVVRAGYEAFGGSVSPDEDSFASPLATTSKSPDTEPSPSSNVSESPSATPTESTVPTETASSEPSDTETTKSPEKDAESVKKVLTIVMENTSREQLAEMPFLTSLSEEYGSSDSFAAVARPSLPNLIAMVTGDTQGIADDKSPKQNAFDGSSVFKEATDNGKSALLYAEGMTMPCQTSDDPKNGYVVRHNPLAYVANERDYCKTHEGNFVDFQLSLKTGLPDIAMLVPSICHDGHDCPRPDADAWLEGVIKKIMKADDWKSGELLVVVAFDESDKRDESNNAPLVVLHPSVSNQIESCKLGTGSLYHLFGEVAELSGHAMKPAKQTVLGCFGLHVAKE